MDAWGLSTRAIHVGSAPDAASGAVVPPITLSTTFAQAAPGQLAAGFDYGRSGNPSRQALESCLAAVERGGVDALAYSSGLAATDSIMRLAPPGAKIVVCDDVYGGTRRLFTRVAAVNGAGLNFVFVNLSDPATFSTITSDTWLVWLETPTNPTMKLVDIAAVSSHVKSVCPSAIVVVDNTFLSPAGQSPITLGADIVVHSCTKYINGHSDVIMGTVILSGSDNAKSVQSRLRFNQNATGAVPSPFDCYMCQRGLKTLALRFERHCSNALAVARLLESSPKVQRVAYPGLESHPQHELAKRQQKGFGGMICVWLKHKDAPGAALEASTKFFGSLKLFCLAESLGGIESLTELPSVMTHASVPEKERAELGISDAMVRLSVGVEDLADLLADVRAALDAVPSV